MFTCNAIFGGGGGGAADSLMSLSGNSAGNNENVFLMGSHSGRSLSNILSSVYLYSSLFLYKKNK